MDDVLNTDYGGFNPRFLGVSYYFDSPDDFDFFSGAMLAAEPLARSSGSEANLHQIALTSVVDHEHRHYLDFLLSPYSTTVLRMRLQALINGISGMASLRELKGDVIPVPLARWMIMPEAERRVHEKEWSELFGRDVRAVQLATRSQSDLLSHLPRREEAIGHLSKQEQFDAATDFAVRAYLRIGQLTEGFGVGASTKHLRPPYIHEASALSAQLAAIWTAQGELEFFRFALYLLNSDAPQAKAWQTCYRLARVMSGDQETEFDAESSLFTPLRRVPSITTWSLFGNHQLDGSDGCPTNRLSRLMSEVLKAPGDPRWTCDMDDLVSIAQMWSRWDEATGLRPWEEALAGNIDITRRAIEQYRRLRVVARPAKIDRLIVSLIALLDQLIDHQEVALKALKSDLRQIVDPFRFVTMPENDTPLADIRLEFRGWAVDPTWVTAGRPIIRRHVATGAEVAIGVAFALGESGAESHALLEHKLEVEELMELCDLLYSELTVPDHIYPSARRGIEKLTGKCVIQLL